jgi:RNA polymerase sigma-70 factor, ECF subfamily
MDVALVLRVVHRGDSSTKVALASIRSLRAGVLDDGGMTGIATAPFRNGEERVVESVDRIGSTGELSDEELMRRLAGGDVSALAPLYERYAALIFAIARESLDRPTAEEIVQDVVVAIWRKARTYDPARGPVRPWLLQTARLRVINELRRRGRRPATISDPRDLQLSAVPDDAPEPDEAIWQDFRRTAIQEAVAALPDAQRQALRLAFFDGLSHTQVADFLGLPLGTAKTRIRTGMLRLQGVLRPLMTILLVAAIGGAVVLGLRDRDQRARQERLENALGLVTSSDATAFRLTAAPGIDPQTHGMYRTRPGADLAVLTLSSFAPAPAGEVYQIWVRYGGVWQSLGTVTPDANGHALLVVDQRTTGDPEALEITLEPKGGRSVPGTRVVVAWTAP